MARLQDFPTVTPTSSDKLLVVQSQSQGLVPYGSKLDSANPTGTGTLSMNRKASTTVGTNSATFGKNGTASGDYSFATGTFYRHYRLSQHRLRDAELLQACNRKQEQPYDGRFSCAET